MKQSLMRLYLEHAAPLVLTKVSLCFLAALVFLTSSVVGMQGAITPKKRLWHAFQTPGGNEYFTPEQGSIEQKTAFNRAQADRVNESESGEEDDGNFLEQRGDTVRIFESVHEGAAQKLKKITMHWEVLLFNMVLLLSGVRHEQPWALLALGVSLSLLWCIITVFLS